MNKTKTNALNEVINELEAAVKLKEKAEQQGQADNANYAAGLARGLEIALLEIASINELN